MPPPPAAALAPSLLDRLIDPEAGGPGLRVGYTLEQMMAAVRKDLEDLLNTRSPFADLPPEYPQAGRSVLCYGVPDLTSLPASDDADRAALGGMLAAAIAAHEPRLKAVRVTLVEDTDGTDLRVKFRIDARLAVDPSPEIGFVTVLELFTGQASVAQGDE